MHTILVYHTISCRRDPLAGNIDISPARFEQQLRWLSRRRNVIRLDETLRAPRLPQTTAITFDDGFKDNLTVALPLLERFGLPMTLFVTAGFLGCGEYLDAAELRELSAHPPITIGAHGLWHRHFHRLTSDEARFELLESRRLLAAITGRDTTLLAWPYGECNRRLERLAEECGYRAAWSVWKGNNTTYSRWRVPLARHDNLMRFIAKAGGVYAWTKANWNRLHEREADGPMDESVAPTGVNLRAPEFD